MRIWDVQKVAVDVVKYSVGAVLSPRNRPSIMEQSREARILVHINRIRREEPRAVTELLAIQGSCSLPTRT